MGYGQESHGVSSILLGALRSAERTLRGHPPLLFGVVVNVILAGLAIVMSAERSAFLWAIAAVTVLALGAWRFGPRTTARSIVIDDARDVRVRDSLNRTSPDGEDLHLNIETSSGVTVERVMNESRSRESGQRQGPGGEPGNKE